MSESVRMFTLYRAAITKKLHNPFGVAEFFCYFVISLEDTRNVCLNVD